MAEYYTVADVAVLLSVSQAELLATLEQRRAELPAYDPANPLLTEQHVQMLRSMLQQNPPQPAGMQPAGMQPAGAQPAGSRGATVFAITSGKGGVGKTSLSVNMATEFAKRGFRTIIVDTDLGLANTHILAGIKPSHTLCDYLEGRVELGSIIETGPHNVKFISGGSGVKEMANLDDGGRQRILDAVDQLRPHCDVILLDTAAGVSRSVTDFVSIADHTIVVTTSNFAAIADAYGIIKVLVQEGFKAPMHSVVNRVRSPEEAEQVFVKLKGCAERFLSYDLNWLGLLPEDNSVESAVLKRSPFCEVYPGSVATRYLAKIVTALERYVNATPSPTTGQEATR